MAKGWTCPRCSTKNDEAAYNCSSCRLIRGSVVVPSSEAPPLPATPLTTADAPSSGVAAVPQSEPEAAPSAWALGATAEADASAPVEPKPFWRRIPLSWALWGVLILGGSIAGVVFNAARDDEGGITKSGDLKIYDLRVGDCFDLKDPTAELIEDVNAVPCTQEHEYEMFHIGSMSAGAYPTDEAFTSFVEASCLPTFETFVGISYEASELDVFWVVPSTESWNDGDRSVQCAVYHPRIHRLTESQKGSAR